MKKTLAIRGEKYSIAEKAHIDKALKLYKKAAEAAGKMDLVKRILAMREDEADELIPENMKGENLDSKAEKGLIIVEKFLQEMSLLHWLCSGRFLQKQRLET